MSNNKDTNQNIPIVAICYDFDKTLSPDDMQAQGYIQSVGYDVDAFWRETNEFAKENQMDTNLAYMYKMIQKAHGKLRFTKETLQNYGEKVSLFSGVDSWFDRINEYGKEQGVNVEHYIISCGLKEMINGTVLAKQNVFKCIYASSFYYDENGEALWPAQVINFTNKTQFLFRISKGALDVSDESVNDSMQPDEFRVPFKNMIYIGDSATDIPCMKLINSYNGHSIGVFDPNNKDKTKVHKMMRDGRIKYYAPADYTENSELDRLVKTIISVMAANEKLERIHNDCSLSKR